MHQMQLPGLDFLRDADGNIIDQNGNILHPDYEWTVTTTGMPVMEIVWYTEDGELSDAQILDPETGGYKDYRQYTSKMGSEYGLLGAYRNIWDLTEGVPGAVNNYIEAVRQYKDAELQMPDIYRELMYPFLGVWADVGERYLSQSEEWDQAGEDIKDQYDFLWNDIQDRYSGLDLDLRVLTEQQRRVAEQQGKLAQRQMALAEDQYGVAQQITPGADVGINFGPMSLQAQDLRSIGEKRAALGEVGQTYRDVGGTYQDMGGTYRDVAGTMGTRGDLFGQRDTAMGGLLSDQLNAEYMLGQLGLQGLGGYAQAAEQMQRIPAGLAAILEQQPARIWAADQALWEALGLWPLNATLQEGSAQLGVGGSGSSPVVNPYLGPMLQAGGAVLPMMMEGLGQLWPGSNPGGMQYSPDVGYGAGLGPGLV
jgi:heat shock protein HspQ